MLKIFEKLNTYLQFRLKLMNVAQHKQYSFNMSCRSDNKQIYCDFFFCITVIYLKVAVCVTCYQLAFVGTSPVCVPVKERKDAHYHKFTRSLHNEY